MKDHEIPFANGKITREIIKKAERHLSKDAVMEKLIAVHGSCPLADTCYRPFQTLARSIIGQQLSAKAANTIGSRVRKVIKGELVPKRIHDTPVEIFRAAGLSQAKAKYLKELARRVLSKELDFSKLKDKTDEEVINNLIALPGIGRWTSEMFLIFGLKRQNVIALDDAGLRRAVKLLYEEELETCQDRWQPYRSIASWYLWQHLDS